MNKIKQPTLVFFLLLTQQSTNGEEINPFVCVSLSSFFSLGSRYNFKPSKSPSCPDGAQNHGKKRSSSEHSPPQPTPRQTNPSSHTSNTHSLTHTHTTHRNTKSLCHAPSTRGSNMFWRLLLLCSDPPSVHIHRGKARGRKVKSRRRQNARSVEGTTQEKRPKSPALPKRRGGSARARSGSAAPRGPSARPGRAPRRSLRLPSLIPGGAVVVPWGAAGRARTSSQLLFPAVTESA